MEAHKARENGTDPATIDIVSAARLLGIGRTLAYELAAKGELPGVLRLGHRLVVSRKALNRFLDAESDLKRA